MEVTCKNCGRINPQSGLFCTHCKLPLKPYQEISKKLYDRVDRLEKEYHSQITELKDQLQLLNQHFEQPTAEEAIKVASSKPVAEAISSEKQEDQLPKVVKEKPSRPQKVVRSAPAPRIPREPTVFEKQMAAFFKPLTDSLTWLNGLYIKYKKEGKLPIFLMTIAGIIAMLFGFGYLMQVTFQRLGPYEPVAKIGVGFLAALTTIIIALRLYRQREKYGEYASALASLGIVLNYLMIYFLSDLGNFPVLSSAVLGFALIAVNTVVAILLSLRFQTKIVAFLSLVGGAFAPFYLNSTDDSTLYYAYLWILVVAANVVAARIKWHQLHYISFVVGIGLLGFAAFAYSPSTLVFTIYYHVYAYLFFYYSFFKNFQLKEELSRTEIVLLCGNMSFLLYSLYAAYEDDQLILGILYLANALVIGGLSFYHWSKALTSIRQVLPVLVATFIALAIPALFEHSLMGFFWSTEAILIIQLGFIGKLSIVRNQGYLLLVVGLGKIGYSILGLAALPAYEPWGDWYFNSLALVLVLLILWRQFVRYQSQWIDFEQGLHRVFSSFFPIFLSAICWVTCYNLLDNWSFPFSIMLFFGLLWWGYQFNNRFVSFSAFLFLPILFLAFILSAAEVGSLYLIDQLPYAQVSLVFLLAALWFVRKFLKLLGEADEDLQRFTQNLRILFFLLLPIVPLNFVKKFLPDYLGVSLWVSVLIPFYLHRVLKYPALLLEFYGLAAVATLFGFNELNLSTAIGGSLVILIVHFQEKSYLMTPEREQGFDLFHFISPFVGLLFLVSLPYFIFDSSLTLPILLYGTGLAVLSYFKNQFAFLKPSFPMAITISILLNLPIILLPLDLISQSNDALVLLGWINLGLIFVILINKLGWYESYNNAKWTIDLIFSQLMLMLVYLVTIKVLQPPLENIFYTIFLAAHGVGLVFISLKNRLKTPNYLSIAIFTIALLKVVFHDIAELATIQKVIVLIALGLLLLGAAYLYTRLKKHFEENSPIANSADNHEEEE